MISPEPFPREMRLKLAENMRKVERFECDWEERRVMNKLMGWLIKAMIIIMIIFGVVMGLGTMIFQILQSLGIM